MGRQRGNPWYGIWNEDENDGYHDLHPIPTPALDKAREEEFRKRYETKDEWDVVYYVDPELLKQGIIKKVDK